MKRVVDASVAIKWYIPEIYEQEGSRLQQNGDEFHAPEPTCKDNPCMKIFLFACYYLKLRLNILLGFHRTFNPLNIRWRWKYWRSKQSLSDFSRLF